MRQVATTRISNLTVLLIVSAFVLCSTPILAKGWGSFTNTDEITDEVTTFASVKNNNSSFFVYTKKSGEYIGGFWLNKGTFDMIQSRPRHIVVRVDKNEPHTVGFYSWEPKKVYFDLTNYTQLTDEMMKGTTVIIQYPSSRTQSKVERFSLSNSEKMLRNALVDYRTVQEIEQDRINGLEEQKVKEKTAFEEQTKYREEQGKRYSIECPDQWNEFKKQEKEYGPQLWRGCDK